MSIWRLTLHHPSREGLTDGASEYVSWLRASTRLPSFPVANESTCLPFTVAGPRRIYTGFRAPHSLVGCQPQTVNCQRPDQEPTAGTPYPLA
jgi:hypothetical protein